MFSHIWETRTDSLPCYLPLFILKLSECNRVELSAAFLAAFSNFKPFFSTWVILAPF